MHEFVPFNELLINVVDNRGKTAPTADHGIPLIATNCIKPDSIYPLFEKVRYVSEETYKSWFRGHPEPDDIIFVTKGSPGNTALVPNPVDFCIAQDMVAIRADPKKICSKYLFALLRSEQTLADIQGLHVGTMIPHFKKGDFNRLHLPVPNREQQELIGGTYFELSNKIELNRQMNQTLDEIARTLFRSWFVDFDPVRAKAAGRQPDGMDAETAALFPDRLVDSELGPIPEGWQWRPLDQIGSFLNGLALQKYPPRNDGSDLPVIKIAQLRANSTSGAALANRDVPPQYQIKDGDFLFSWSGSLLASIWSGGEGSLNQHLFKVSSDYPKWFIYYWVQEHLEHFRSVAADKATTMGHINRHHLSSAMCAVPVDTRLWQSADSAIGPTVALGLNNALESGSLGELRDVLLPELLSGRLSVPEIVGVA